MKEVHTSWKWNYVSWAILWCCWTFSHVEFFFLHRHPASFDRMCSRACLHTRNWLLRRILQNFSICWCLRKILRLHDWTPRQLLLRRRIHLRWQQIWVPTRISRHLRICYWDRASRRLIKELTVIFIFIKLIFGLCVSCWRNTKNRRNKKSINFFVTKSYLMAFFHQLINTVSKLSLIYLIKRRQKSAFLCERD